MEPIHKRLKRLREAKGLTALQMAKALGVPASTYREWEYGRAIRGEPYVKIAEILGVSLEELLTGRRSGPSNFNPLLDEIENLLKELRARLTISGS